MAQDPRSQQRTDAQRIGDAGTGKLDRDARGDSDVVRRQPDAAESPASADDARARLVAAHEAAVDEFRRLGLSPEPDAAVSRGATGAALDEGDQAQASERQDVEFATRERLADRITRLTDALARLDEGTYGECVSCGGRIEARRLVALPEAETCLGCQERREQTERERAA